MDKIYFKCIECNNRFDGNDKTVKCPKCDSEDIKEQNQSRIHTHNPYYTNSLFKNN